MDVSEICEWTDYALHNTAHPTGSDMKKNRTRMWANAQRDGRPAKHRWRLLFNVAKSG